jgi:hypothetical protein
MTVRLDSGRGRAEKQACIYAHRAKFLTFPKPKQKRQKLKYSMKG